MKNRRRLLSLIPLTLLGHGIHAQETPTLIAQQGSWQLPATPPIHQPQALPFQIALPTIVASGAPASITFFGITGEQRSGPAAAFPFGITALEYQVRINGAAGLSYQEEWSLDGTRQPQLDSQSTIPSDVAVFTNRIQLNTGAALPRGVYRLRVLVGGLVGADVSVDVL